MLDVHPPHSPTHTWKDFFIHIATIVVGLLIAVGLGTAHQFADRTRRSAELANQNDVPDIIEIHHHRYLTSSPGSSQGTEPAGCG